MKKKILFFTLTVISAFTLFAQNSQTAAPKTAEEIVRASRDRIKATTFSTRSKMTITAKNGTSSERVVDQYSKDGPKGARAMIVY